jgi:uncharacterized protein YlzI (FlbEa/FlbD family)
MFKKFTLVGGNGDGKEVIINMDHIVSMNEVEDGNTILISTVTTETTDLISTHVSFVVNESLNEILNRIT